MRCAISAVLTILVTGSLGACSKVWYENGTALTGTSRPLPTTASARAVYRPEVKYSDDGQQIMPTQQLTAFRTPPCRLTLGS